MEQEKTFKAMNGYSMLTILLILFIGSIVGIIVAKMIPLLVITILTAFLSIGFVIVNPNESSVLVLFGAYKGTIKKYGFFWVNPFFVKKKISLSVPATSTAIPSK